MVAWSIKRCLGGYWNTKSNYLFYIMHAFSLYTESECMRLFEFVSFILQFRSLKERFNTNTSRSKSYHEVYPYISPKLITSTKKWSFSSHQFFYTSYYRHDSNAVRPSLGDCPFPICMAYLPTDSERKRTGLPMRQSGIFYILLRFSKRFRNLRSVSVRHTPPDHCRIRDKQ